MRTRLQVKERCGQAHGFIPALNIRSLVTRGLHEPSVSDEAWNPLRENDQLQEAILIDVLFDLTTSTVGILFDIGNALQVRDGAVGLLVVRGTDGLNWDAERRENTYLVWTVLSSRPDVEEGAFKIRLGTFPDAELVVAGRSAEYYEFDVSGGEPVDDPARETVGQHPTWVRPTWTQNYTMHNFWFCSTETEG